MTAVTADDNIIVVGLAFTQRPRHEVTRVGHMLFDETVRVSGQEKRMSERGRERERGGGSKEEIVNSRRRQ